MRSLKKSGVFWMLISVMCFSTMQLFVKITDERISVYQQIFFRNLLAAGVSYYYLRKLGGSMFGKLKDQPYLFARSLFGFLGLVFFFYATRMGNVADVTIINRTNPFFTTLFSAVFLKQVVKLKDWGILMLVFIGGVIASNPSFDSTALPAILAFLSAISNGIAYTLLGYFRNKVPTMVVVMHFSMFSIVASIPFVIVDYYVPTLSAYMSLLMIAILGSFGQIAITIAYRCAEAAEISPFDQLSIVMSMICGVTILGQHISVQTLIGGGIIILSSILNYVMHNRARRNANC